MAVYRSDQAQLTFAAEAGQGGDPEMMEGTTAAGPVGITLSGAHKAGARTLTLSAEVAAHNSAAGDAILTAEEVAADEGTSGDRVTVDGSHGITVNRVIKIDDEKMLVTVVSTNDLELTRGYEATGASSGEGAAAAHSDDDAISSRFMRGDFIRIGTLAGTVADTVFTHEVRRVEYSKGTTVILDRPLAFDHGDGQALTCVSAIGGDAQRNDLDKYITFIPGIYESVDTPDPVMSISGRRFLNTQSKRNYSIAYAGQQSLTGSLSGIVLINGWPLRFPIGSVVTKPQSLNGTAHELEVAASKGDVFITLKASTNLGINDYLCIDDGSTTKSEVRKLIYNSSGTDVWRLNAPLQFDHLVDASCEEVGSSNAYYDHTIIETTDLDTVSWHVHMKDSSETTTKDFDRRYVGGMIGSSTISADEGGMVSMSWDSVSFLNMIHNQASQNTVSTNTNLYHDATVDANMPRYALMQSIDKDDVGQPAHATGTGSSYTAANDGTGYPTTEPYYFSQGTIKYFGTEFARIRSFSLSISNGEEARYYIGRQGNRMRGPYEIREGQRSYSMSASVVLPDAEYDATTTAASALKDGATELFKQLLLEGNYGGTTSTTTMTGFTASIKFERGDNDYIVIDIPGGTTAETPATAENKLDSQGIFINSAPHGITGENPFQVDLDMIFGSLKIYVRDNVAVYP